MTIGEVLKRSDKVYQSLQPTAGRLKSTFDLMKQFSMFATLVGRQRWLSSISLGAFRSP
jgi:hypothetical protein